MINLLKKIIGIGADEKPIREAIARGAKIIDVRTANEFSLGHVKGSINIPLNTIENNVGAIKKFNKPVIFCCASGMRSAQATRILKNSELNEIYNGGSWMNVNSIINA